MRSDGSLQRARGTRVVLASSIAIGIATLACAVVSCAGSDETPSVTPDGSTPLPGLDATSDATLDAACLDAGEGGNCEPARSCAEADFCEVATGVDTRYTLLDVWGSSKSDVWAVGSGGTIIHWDGAAWTRVPLAVQDTLRGVGGSSASDVWIVSSVSLVLHSSGFGTAAGFTRQPLIPRADWTTGRGAVSKVWAANSGDLFVGGHTAFPGVQGDSLWRFHSDFDADAGIPAWEPVSTYSQVLPYAGVEGLWGTNASDIWVIGEAGLVRRSKGPVGDGGGEQWSTMETTLTTETLHGIWGSSNSDVWIVGDHGTIRHWSGDGAQHWTAVPSPTTEDLRAVWGTGPSDAWAVGDGGTILHWDGTRWSAVTTTLPTGSRPRMSGVWGSGPSDVWVVGEAGALHFGGAKTASTPATDGGGR